MASDTEPTTGDIPGSSAKEGIEAAAATIARMTADMAKMAGFAKEIGKELKALKDLGKALQGAGAPGTGGVGAGNAAIPATAMAAIPSQGAQRQGPRAGFGAAEKDLGTGGGTIGAQDFGGVAAPLANQAGLLSSTGGVAGPAVAQQAVAVPAAAASPGAARAGSAMAGSPGVVSAGAAGSPLASAATPVGGGIGAGQGGLPPAPVLGDAGGTGTQEHEQATVGVGPSQQMIGMGGSGQGSDEGGGGFGAAGMVLKGAKFVGGMAMAGVNDLRFGREEGLRYEKNRLIAFGGTGNFDRFKDNLNVALNNVNTLNRVEVEEDLAQAYGGYYAQGMGGGKGGEIRTAQTVGAMHTLAAIGGIDANKVGGATDSMYSSQAYYKAMAAGIMTRDPTTGDMMTPEEIINQYRGRFKDNTPDQIRRALAPGGAFAAELRQTWGSESGLAEMISEGILVTSKTGRAIPAGGLDEEASTKDGGAGYAGSRWTQGRDSEARRLRSEERRLATYADAITEGVSVANTAVTAINNLLTNLPQPLKKMVEGMEFMGAALDTFNTTMPQSTAKMIDAIESLTSKVLGWLTGGLLQDIIGVVIGGSSEGDWFVEKNKPVNVHQGEMILPNRIATAVRSELQMSRTTADTPSSTYNLQTPKGKAAGSSGGGVNIYLTIQNASDAEAQNFARRVKGIIEGDRELVSMGTGQFG